MGFVAFSLASSPLQAATAPDLGSTSPYAIVSATFTNTTAGTTIDGDVCYTTAPAVIPFITGATVVPCPDVTGTDQDAARSDLVSQDCTSIGAAVALNDISIGGGTPGEFPPGCYSSTGAMSITAGTTVTLSGTGVYIFRPAGAITTGADSHVVAAGGACEDDVFWAPDGGTTIGANATFIGNVFRGTAAGLSITFGNSSALTGRALAFGSTVTTDSTAIIVPDACAEPATITVNKDFIPNSPDTVPVSLSCTSGTVTTTPLNASEAEPAVFTVTGASPGATCTATETVPAGYTASQGDCVGVALNGSCTITNTLNEDTIVVNKDFVPNSLASVQVDLSCSSGTVTATPLDAAEGAPAVFTVTGATPGATCTATETVPAGYTATQGDCIGVALGGSCTITNTLNEDTIVVNKDFIPNSTESVPVALTCTSGTVTTTPLDASEALPAVFTIKGANPEATCTATETVPAGYTANQLDCVNVPLGGNCTITNTVNSDTIVVNKDFTPDSDELVSVALSCTSGSVTTTPLDAAEGAPAVFTVTGASPGATCTATETVPVGYTANQSDCVDVSLDGSCTIHNSINSNTITVNKDFSPNSVASVPVALSCTSGTVTTTPLNASETQPAVFTVTGASPGTTCTATETVPVGYTANQANCENVALGGICTITNTLNEDTIVVNKDFVPNSLAPVQVELSCTSGTVTTTPLDAAEGAPAVFTVTGASPGATCTATETVPTGYTANQLDCVDVALGGSCEIINTLNDDTIIVHKDFSPNSPAAVPVALNCTSGTVTTTPLNAAEGAPAVFTVTGASPGATCTATETVPDGYTANQTDCVEVALGDSCEITNIQDIPPGRATFRVIKHFTDGNPMDVEVTIRCNTGLPLQQSTEINENSDVEFVVTSFNAGELDCDVTETFAPGYTPAYSASASTGQGLVSHDDEGCHFDDVVSGQFVCSIVNTPSLVEIEVEKLWVIDGMGSAGIDTRYTLRLFCDEPIGLVDVFEGLGSDTFFAQVAPQYPSTHCWVVETVFSSGVEVDNDCDDLVISADRGGDSCVITNTVFFEGIPTLGRYGLTLLTLLMLGIGLVGLRRFG